MRTDLSRLWQSVLIDVPLVDTVQMPVMQIVDMTFVFDGGMPASRTVRVRMLIVCFALAHLGGLLTRRVLFISRF
jgi:hypothetical protein